MKSKKLIYITIITSLGLPLFASADMRDDAFFRKEPAITTVSYLNENEHEMWGKRDVLSTLKSRGERLIKERISTLQSNKTVITGSKTLLDAQKASLTSRIDANIASLTTLSLAIGSSTDATSTKALIESVYSKFRIYGIVIPQLRLEKRIYDAQNYIAELPTLFARVEEKIKAAKEKGQDTAVWEKNLADAKAKMATNSATLADIFKKVDALTPAEYGTSSKLTIDAANTALKSVMQDLRGLRKLTQHKGELKKSQGFLMGNSHGEKKEVEAR